jgi:RNA polymerase I specific transcription initiation factor RRN3
MGALDKVSIPYAVTRIESALAAKQAGDGSELSNLLLALSPANDPAQTASILVGLTHFTATLDNPDISACRSYELRRLLHAAINMDFSSCVPCATASVNGDSVTASDGTCDAALDTTSAVSTVLLDAYRDFLFNTASADSGFVEDLLSAFARLHFRLPFPAFASLVNCIHDVVPTILDTYPSAEAALIRVVAEKYPHPVRPEDEHQNYVRAVLMIASCATSPSLAASLISIVVERIAIIDASVPEQVGQFVLDSRALSPVSLTSQDSNLKVLDKTHLPEPCPGIFAAVENDATSAGAEEIVGFENPSGEFVLDPGALKMDLVSSEFLEFSKLWLRGDFGDAEVSRRLEAVSRAIERFVLPAQSTYAPFLLLHAASIAGKHHLNSLAERFRVSFFDPKLSRRVRISYLYCSSSLISRASVNTAADLISWVSKVANWLHSYIDRHDSLNTTLDTDVNDVFYAGIFAIMSAICNRPSVFDPYAGGDRELADGLRFRRLMLSRMNPLLVMPSDLVSKFCSLVQERCGMDLGDVQLANRNRSMPSRTRYGSQNRFHGSLPMMTCALPQISRHLQQVLSIESSSLEQGQREFKRRRLTCGGIAHISLDSGHLSFDQKTELSSVSVGQKRSFRCVERESV